MLRPTHVTHVAWLAVLCACSSSSNNNQASGPEGGTSGTDGAGPAFEAGAARDPNTASVVSVDRFSDAFAHLFKRSGNPAFPAPNAPINCDQGAFITRGLGPNGEKVAYYNFDVLPTTPAPIYVLFAGSTQVQGQLNIIDVVPGDPGYNDFWRDRQSNGPFGLRRQLGDEPAGNPRSRLRHDHDEHARQLPRRPRGLDRRPAVHHGIAIPSARLVSRSSRQLFLVRRASHHDDIRRRGSRRTDPRCVQHRPQPNQRHERSSFRASSPNPARCRRTTSSRLCRPTPRIAPSGP